MFYNQFVEDDIALVIGLTVIMILTVSCVVVKVPRREKASAIPDIF